MWPIKMHLEVQPIITFFMTSGISAVTTETQYRMEYCTLVLLSAVAAKVEVAAVLAVVV